MSDMRSVRMFGFALQNVNDWSEQARERLFAQCRDSQPASSRHRSYRRSSRRAINQCQFCSPQIDH